MEYNYYLDGLCCPNCAAKIERGLNQHKKVENASIVFMKKKLILCTHEKMSDSFYEEIYKIIRDIESEICMKPYHTTMDHDKKEIVKKDNYKIRKRKNLKMTLLVFGVVLFIFTFILQEFKIFKDGIYLWFYFLSYILVAYDVVLQSICNIKKGDIFDEFFLMSVATIGALLIGEYPEAVAVMLFYKLGEYLQGKAVNQARSSIESLVQLKPDFANVIKKDGSVLALHPEEVKVGDVIEVKSGERVPLDGILLDGETALNMSALTGETKPVDVQVGMEVLSGSINITNYMRMKVTKIYAESTVARIMKMVEQAADKKSRAEKFVTRFSRVYTPIVCFFALALALIPPLLFGGAWSSWIYNALSFLVVSCPCALVISVPLGFFGGIGVASKNGILLKGGNYIEALADVSVIAFDKTGTLTKGNFKVTERVIDQKGMKQVRKRLQSKAEELKDLLSEENIENLFMYLFSLAEIKTNHPIGKSILDASVFEVKIEEVFHIEEMTGYGIVADTVYGKIYIGNEKMMERFEISYKKNVSQSTVIYGALESCYMGAIVISDEIKEDVIDGIQKLKEEGIIHTVLLSGDQKDCVEEVAKYVGIEVYCGELLPGEKLEKIESIYQENPGVKVAYVGDGINDAPVLARADVGIAMGGVGQDAAIEAADMVLMTDEIGKIAKAISISKYTRQIVIENILLALGIKTVVLILIAFGQSTMWMAVFADVGAALIAVCNSIRVYKHKF